MAISVLRCYNWRQFLNIIKSSICDLIQSLVVSSLLLSIPCIEIYLLLVAKCNFIKLIFKVITRSPIEKRKARSGVASNQFDYIFRSFGTFGIQFLIYDC